MSHVCLGVLVACTCGDITPQQPPRMGAWVWPSSHALALAVWGALAAAVALGAEFLRAALPADPLEDVVLALCVGAVAAAVVQRTALSIPVRALAVELGEALTICGRRPRTPEVNVLFFDVLLQESRVSPVLEKIVLRVDVRDAKRFSIPRFHVHGTIELLQCPEVTL